MLKLTSLSSKRFRLVSEQKKTVERDFRIWTREKWNENQKNERGRRGGGRKFPSFLPQPSPLFYLRHFSRGLWLLFSIICSWTTQKRLPSRLEIGRSTSRHMAVLPPNHVKDVDILLGLIVHSEINWLTSGFMYVIYHTIAFYTQSTQSILATTWFWVLYNFSSVTC